MQRNAPYRNATQQAATHRCAQSKNSVMQRNASAVTVLCKQIETSSIFSVRRKDDKQSEQPTAKT